MKTIVAFLMALILSGLSVPAYAVPAAPIIHELRQVDGISFKAVLWGDENLSGWDTLDGFTIVENELTGEWQYAEHDSKGYLRASTERAASGRSPRHGLKKLRPRGRP